MYEAIQCKDGRTNEVGSFGFREKIRMVGGNELFYSLTPVFKDLNDLYKYMRDNNIKVDHTPINYTDVPYRTH